MSAAAPIRKEQVAWALRTLDIPSEATTATVRSAMIAQLEEAEFVPPPVVAEALQVLAPLSGSSCEKFPAAATYPPVAQTTCFDLHVERRTREMVDAFAEQFFALPVPGRQAAWARLAEQAGRFPAVMLRLHALWPGLTFDRTAVEDPEHQKLADACMQMFVMRPACRAAARDALLARRKEKDWVKSVRRFAKRYPDYAALAPEFFARLEESRRTLRQPATVVQRRATRQEQRMGWVFAVIAVCALLGLFVGRSSRDNRSSPSWQNRSWSVPPANPNANIDRAMERIRKQAREMRERERSIWPEGVPPSGNSERGQMAIQQERKDFFRQDGSQLPFPAADGGNIDLQLDPNVVPPVPPQGAYRIGEDERLILPNRTLPPVRPRGAYRIGEDGQLIPPDSTLPSGRLPTGPGGFPRP